MTKKEIKKYAQKIAQIETDDTISNSKKEELIYQIIATFSAQDILAIGNQVDKILDNK